MQHPFNTNLKSEWKGLIPVKPCHWHAHVKNTKNSINYSSLMTRNETLVRLSVASTILFHNNAICDNVNVNNVLLLQPTKMIPMSRLVQLTFWWLKVNHAFFSLILSNGPLRLARWRLTTIGCTSWYSVRRPNTPPVGLMMFVLRVFKFLVGTDY